MQAVVGVALLREGRVLAARRSGPPALAGLWEFPGGKVEPGEDPRVTAVREIVVGVGTTGTMRSYALHTLSFDRISMPVLK